MKIKIKTENADRQRNGHLKTMKILIKSRYNNNNKKPYPNRCMWLATYKSLKESSQQHIAG